MLDNIPLLNLDHQKGNNSSFALPKMLGSGQWLYFKIDVSSKRLIQAIIYQLITITDSSIKL